MNRDLIALRNGFIQIPTNSGVIKPNHVQVVMSTQAELMKLGYMLSQDAVNALSEVETSSVIKFHNRSIEYLRKMLGADRNYRPFYINFPDQVMEMSDVELFVNAVLHYWSGGVWEPSQEMKRRGVKFENVNFKVLTPVSGDEWLRQIARDLAAFPKPLDAQRLEELIWIAQNVPNVEVGYISVKETLCALGAAGIAVPLTSPTDVLRIATGLSGGDIALPSLPKPNAMTDYSYRYNTKRQDAEQLRETFKFKKFTRAQRKYLLGMIESLKTIDVSEMARHLGRWIRLGEILHPGEYASKYPRTYEAFQKLRNEKVRTFAGQVDVSFAKSAKEGMKVLKTRPGEFARRLDSLVRTYGDLTLPHFAEIVDKVSSKVVFEMFDHFESRRKSSPRSVMLKGGKMQVLDDLPALPKRTVDAIQEIVLGSMTKRFSKLPKMGSVYLDPALKNMPVPFSMQSSSEGVSTMVRGTRIPFSDDAKTVRGYCHWYDEKCNIDIDLAATFLDENFNELAIVSYWNLRHGDLGVAHSGDVRHRLGDCAEYLDVPIEKCRNKGVRYVIFQAYNYNGGSLASVPGCTFGVMEREYPKNNDIFDAKTVTNSVKMSSPGNSAFPVAFDLELKQWIWVDLKSDQHGVANALSGSEKEQLKAIVQGSKISVYDLLKMHVDARGGKLVWLDEADEHFMESDFRDGYSKLTPFMAI